MGVKPFGFHKFFVVIIMAYFLVLQIDVTLSKSKSPRDGEITKILDTMFDKYDRRVRPYYAEKPVEVYMSAHILDIYGIDEIRQEFTVNMYIRQHWTDPRLKFKINPDQYDGGLERVLVDSNHSNYMWLPDTFIVNQRKLEPSTNTYNEATMISYDGSVIQSKKIITTVSCKFDLSYFPFDRQICSLELKSYGHTASDIYYKWRHVGKNLIDVSEDTTNTRFRISSVSPKEIYLTSHGLNISGVVMEFKLERFSSRYVSDIFFPIAVLTSLSFLTLLIEHTRRSIKISSIILATMTIFISISMVNIPKVSYQTAMDVYLLFSYIFVSTAVATNFVLGYNKRELNHGRRSSHRREALEMEEISPKRDNFHSSIDTLGEDKFKLGRPNFLTSVEYAIRWILSKGKILLPIMFITFNIAYWIGITVGSRITNWEPISTQDINNDVI